MQALVMGNSKTSMKSEPGTVVTGFPKDKIVRRKDKIAILKTCLLLILYPSAF